MDERSDLADNCYATLLDLDRSIVVSNSIFKIEFLRHTKNKNKVRTEGTIGS
jgi:hypothetical protein